MTTIVIIVVNIIMMSMMRMMMALLALLLPVLLEYRLCYLAFSNPIFAPSSLHRTLTVVQSEREKISIALLYYIITRAALKRKVCTYTEKAKRKNNHKMKRERKNHKVEQEKTMRKIWTGAQRQVMMMKIVWVPDFSYISSACCRSVCTFSLLHTSQDSTPKKYNNVYSVSHLMKR